LLCHLAPIDHISAKMQTSFVIALPEEVGYITEIRGHPVHYSGVGKVNAALAAAVLASKGVQEVINIGSCGSSHHATGEILRIGRVYQDIDCSPICTYGHTAFEVDSHCISFDPRAESSCFTTDYFFDRQQLSKYSPSYLRMISECSVFDMELYALAKSCRHYGMTLRSYKWVSDDGDLAQWLENCLLASHRVMAMPDL